MSRWFGSIVAVLAFTGFAVAQEARVEEVGRLPPGFEPEAAEAQRFARPGEIDEPELVILHGASSP